MTVVPVAELNIDDPAAVAESTAMVLAFTMVGA